MPITLNDTNISVQYGNADNNYIFLEDNFTSTSNLTAEPYLESEERSYPPSRLFTTNNLTLTNQYYMSIACGGEFTVFLTNDGKVYSCGLNTSGQLGRTGTRTVPDLITTTIGSLTISAIACSWEHTVFLTNDGKVYSCGNNTYGQLGRTVDTTNPSSVPSIISTLNSFTISAIACGGFHTVFLTDNGKVYSCGDNYYGQLGQSTSTTTPSQITTNIGSLTISAIACGGLHTVFLTNDGKVYSCGENASGQLGLGNTLQQTTPQPISTLNSLKISAIAGGWAYTVFLTNDGKVYSCGLNTYGQLARTVDTTNPSSVPSIISTLNSFTISAIACGSSHTVFLTNDGKIYSSGLNTDGQLGRTEGTTNPTAFNNLTISAIACGGNHTVFLTNDGKVYSCGANYWGQLGRTGTAATPSIVDTFPLSTIYGSGLYTVSYSSFTSSFEPFKCFNENSTANNQGTWRSGDYLSTGLFDSTTYSTSNLVSGYNGDWLVIKLPVSIKLKRFAIKQLSTALNSAPRKFRLYGSTNGTSLSWTLLIDKQDAVYTSLLYNHTDMSQYAYDTDKYYNHFGLVVNALVGSETTLSFDEFYVYGVELPTYNLITNGNTKTLTIPSINIFKSNLLNSYNITFPVPIFANINNNSNLILEGEYGINLINSTSSTIVPKSGQYIPSSASSLETSVVTIRYSLINPIKDIKGKYVIETVKSDLFLQDLVSTTSNLTIEPYLESGERLYPVSRQFTTNTLTLTSQYYASIACGDTHTVFLTNDGKVYSCGYNNSGQLGLGNTTQQTTPQPISTLSPYTISAISCGFWHTVFLTNDGKVYSCGNNGYGQLGLGDEYNKKTPISISTLNSFTIAAIACGQNHTLFITDEGKVYSCGLNSSGQLGLGNTTDPQNPIEVMGDQTTPEPIPTLNSFTISAIAAGFSHTVFLTNDGKVYSCGLNTNGQLGRTANPQSTPTIISTLSPFTISAIACGYNHTVFLTNEGKVYSCGLNTNGQLGQSTSTTTPSIISTLSPFTISAIKCGKYHTLFLTNDGKVYSCGDNANNQLGRTVDTTNPAATPSIISTLNPFTISAIAGGGNHTLFLTNEGTVYSCGLNTNGQLGLGNTTSIATPSIVNTFPSSSIYGSGLYTVSYSSFTSSFEPFKCFNENSTANNQGTWRSGDYLSTGLFNSATYSTSNLVSGYNGDWLVIKLPLSIKLKRFAIKQLSTALNSAPRNFRLYGSTTGTSWTLLIDKQDAVYTSLLYNHTDMSQYASDTNKYYNHFGLVVNALVGSSTTLSFDEFFVYGIESVPYTPITNANTKTLTIPRYTLNNTLLKSYNITFPVPTFANINNNSNLFLQGEYGINLINSTSNTIVPKSGQFIPSTASSLNTSTISISYSLINPIKDIKGAQWTYNSLNTSVYHMGAVGIGTKNPDYQLDVRGNIYSSTGGLTNSGLTTWSIQSDRRIKENIVKASYDKCLENVKNIELYSFNFKDNYVSTNDKHQLGFIAQEVHAVYPKAVEVGKMILNVEEKIDDLLTLNTTQIDYTLYGAVKKLIEKLDNIKIKIEEIKNK